jgi:hypothetical protein
MTRLSTGLARLALSASVLLLVGCPDDMPTTPGTPGTPATVGADGKPVDLLKLAENQDAKYTDVAVGADGTVHTIYQAQHPRTRVPHVFYRASADGGGTWSEPRDLLDDEPATQAGFVRLAVDGAGRVYAFWETYAGFDVVDPSGGDVSTLAYRALVGGDWTPAATVGEPKQVVGWFPAVAPDGQLHVVWSETIAGPNGRSPHWQAGAIRQATLSGGTVGAAKAVLTSPEVRLGTSSVVNFHGYRGLRGYVDAAGVAHFTALKAIATPEEGAKTEPVSVVHWDGATETPLFEVAKLEAILQKQTYHPPTLWLDAAGQEHLTVVNQFLARPAVEDYAPPTSQTPTLVYQLSGEKGNIRGVQVQPGAGGRAAAMLEMHDTGKADAKHDLWAATFDGRRWTAPVNVTNNGARVAFADAQTSANTSYSTLTTYSAQYGAGAFDAAGRLYLSFVNTEIQSIMRETTVSGGTSGAFGSNSTTNVYFHKL